jgi:hypothetical protein
VIKRDHALKQRGEVLMTRADMIRDWRVTFTIALADESALLPKAQMHEAFIANDDALQPQQFVDIKRRAACLADGPAPALNL